MASSITVANRFLELANTEGDALTPMQLLKLVYIAHGWMLGLYGRPLIGDDVEAWQYGPVIPRLYNSIRHYRGKPVNTTLRAPNGDVLDDLECDIVDQTYKLYGGKTGPALSRLTHQPGSPWHTIYRDKDYGLVIPIDLIEDHYAQLAKKAAA